MNEQNLICRDLKTGMHVVEEIGQYLVSDKVRGWMKGNSWGMFAGLVSTEVLNILEKELLKNGYEIRKLDETA